MIYKLGCRWRWFRKWYWLVTGKWYWGAILFTLELGTGPPEGEDNAR